MDLLMAWLSTVQTPTVRRGGRLSEHWIVRVSLGSSQVLTLLSPLYVRLRCI